MIAPAGWRGVIAETLGCPDPGFFFSGRTGSGSPGRSGGAAGASDEGLQPGAQGGGDGEFEVVGPAAVDGDPIGEDEGLLAFGQGVGVAAGGDDPHGDPQAIVLRAQGGDGGAGDAGPQPEDDAAADVVKGDGGARALAPDADVAVE